MIQSILVDVPDIDAVPQCTSLVTQLAKSESAQVELLTVLPSFGDIFSMFETDKMRDSLQDSLNQQARNALDSIAEDLGSTGVRCNSTVSKGNRERRLISAILKAKARFINKRWKPRG